MSSTLCNVNNVAVGSHPLVTRLLKGVYNLRTPSPRYSSTWDITKVTSYLKTLFPLDQLSLKSLTLKTVMLCALSSALREQTLCVLDIKFLNKSGNSLSFTVCERLKTSRPGKSTRKVEFLSLLEDNSLCPVATLTEYLSRTEGLRKSASSEETRLLFHLLSHTKLCPLLQWQGGLSPYYLLRVLILPYSNLIVFEGPLLPVSMFKVFQSLTFFVWLTGRMRIHFVNIILEIIILLTKSNIFLPVKVIDSMM